MFNKNDINDAISKLIFIAIGCFLGAVCLGVYKLFPQYLSITLILLAALSVFAIFLTERIRYRIRFKLKMNEAAEFAEKAVEDNLTIADDEEESVKKLFSIIKDFKEQGYKRAKIQNAILDLTNDIALNIDLDKLIRVALTRLLEETSSNWGVFYIYNANLNKLELKNSIGLSKNIYREFDVDMGEGFIGLAATEKKLKVYKDIPADTVFENKTFLGKITPKSIMTVPIRSDDELKAVVAFGSMYDYTDDQIEIIDYLKNYVGFAVGNCMSYQRAQRMTRELQFQNQLIQNMNDELEKKVAERTEFLNNIINGIEDYIIISTDKDGYITTWNKGAEIIMGYEAKEVIGRHISGISSDAQKEKELVWRYYETAKDEGRFSSYGWQFKKDGSKYFADTTITPIYDKNGELQGYTNITKDITSAKDLEQQLNNEKAYNDKLIENSARALVYADGNGIIINHNKLSQSYLAPEGADINGKGIFEFFINGDFVERNVKKVCSTGGKGELAAELLYKRDNREKVKLSVVAIDNEESKDNAGVVIYITEV